MICSEGTTLRYADTPPAGFVINVPDNMLIALAGYFKGPTQGQANAKARAALTAYKNAQQTSGNLQCVVAPDPFPEDATLEAESDEVL